MLTPPSIRRRPQRPAQFGVERRPAHGEPLDHEAAALASGDAGLDGVDLNRRVVPGGPAQHRVASCEHGPPALIGRRQGALQADVRRPGREGEIAQGQRTPGFVPGRVRRGGLDANGRHILVVDLNFAGAGVQTAVQAFDAPVRNRRLDPARQLDIGRSRKSRRAGEEQQILDRHRLRHDRPDATAIRHGFDLAV